MPTIPVLVVLAGGLAAGLGLREHPPRPAPLYRCEDSAIGATSVLVARTAAEWDALWPRLGDCAGPTPPAVDFARRAVVVVAYGRAGTTGFSVDVTRVRYRGDTTFVHAVRRRPDCGPVHASVTHPVIAVAAVVLPGPVVLVSRLAEGAPCS